MSMPSISTNRMPGICPTPHLTSPTAWGRNDLSDPGRMGARLRYSDQRLVDIDVDLEDRTVLGTDVEHGALEGPLADGSPAATCLDRIASTPASFVSSTSF